MKTTASIFFCLGLAFFLSQPTSAQKDKNKSKKVEIDDWNRDQVYDLTRTSPKKLPKEIRQALENMVLIPGGSNILGKKEWYNTTEKDSLLLVCNSPRRVSVSSFLMSKTEVTNHEWNEFVWYVRDSVARGILAERFPEYYADPTTKKLNWEIEINWKDSILLDKVYFPEYEQFYGRREYDWRTLNYSYINSGGNHVTINIYPDTMRWVREFVYAYNEPMTHMYAWHPAYDDYPVVGVSWEQAQAYCHWRSEQLKALMRKYSQLPELTRFRFPTEAEWEYAARGEWPYGPLKAGKESKIEEFPWAGYGYLDKNKNYLANIGALLTRNGMYAKTFVEDGGFHTVKVGSYAPNGFGLYDMAGNVSEWTMDVGRPLIMGYHQDAIDRKREKEEAIREEDKRIQKQKDEGTYIGLIGGIYQVEEVKDPYEKRDKELFAQMEHDKTVLSTLENPRIVKGGSWADPLVYQMMSSRQAFEEKSSSCKVGFRLTMTLTKEMLPYFLATQELKKNLKGAKKELWYDN